MLADNFSLEFLNPWQKLLLLEKYKQMHRQSHQQKQMVGAVTISNITETPALYASSGATAWPMHYKEVYSVGEISKWIG